MCATYICIYIYIYIYYIIIIIISKYNNNNYMRGFVLNVLCVVIGLV